MTDLCNIEHTILLVGDFNLPNLHWENGMPKKSNTTSNKEKVITQFFETFSFKQLVTFNTRQKNILDLILTNNE